MNREPNWGELERRGAAETLPADDGIARACARMFTSGDGYEILKWLRAETKERVLGPEASDAALRHLEGGRQLVQRIEGMVKRGVALMAPKGN